MSPAGLDRQHPWPALLAYTEDDREFFGGRQEEAEALSRTIRREHLTILYGRSGLGKTSLLGAGVFPQLRAAGFFPLLIRLDYEDISPPLTEQVKQAIVLEGEKHKVDVPPPSSAAKLWQYFHLRGNDFWDARSRLLKPVIVFDQFEEIFTKGGIDNPKIVEFLDDLTDLVCGVPQGQVEVAGEPPAVPRYHVHEHRCRVVFALREDYFSQLEALNDRFRAIFTNAFRLKPMNGGAALQSAMRAGGHLMDEDTARRVIYVVAGERDPAELGLQPSDEAAQKKLESLTVAPPLLSVFFSELNEERLKNGLPAIAPGVLSATQRDRILMNFYAKCFEGLDEGIRDFVEKWLISEDGKNRDNIAYERAVEIEKVPKAAIEALVQRRLVCVIDDARKAPRIELSHDVLTPVVHANRTERQQRKAREVAEKNTRRQLRRVRVAAGVLLLLIAAVVGWTAFYFTMEHAKKNLARIEYALAIRSLDSGDSSVALAYLGDVLLLDRKHAAARAVLADLVVNRNWPVVRQDQFAVNDSGDRIALFDGQHLTVYDTSGRPVGRPIVLRKNSQEQMRPFAFSQDGKALLTFGARDGVIVRDANTTEVIAGPFEAEHSVRYAALGHDNHWLAVVAEHHVTLYDLSTRKQIFKPIECGDEDKSARFIGDRLLLIGPNSARWWDPRTSKPLTDSIASTAPVEARTVLRRDIGPIDIHDDEIPMLIAMAESLAEMTVDKNGVLQPMASNRKRIEEAIKPCRQRQSPICDAARSLAQSRK